MSFEIELKVTPSAPRDQILREKVAFMEVRIKELWDLLQDEMSLAQTRMEGYANDHRIPAPRYKVGNRV